MTDQIVIVELGDGQRPPRAFVSTEAGLAAVLRARLPSIPLDADGGLAWSLYAGARPDSQRYPSLAVANAHWAACEGDAAVNARAALQVLASYLDFDERR